MKKVNVIKSGLVFLAVTVLFSCTKDEKPTYSHFISKDQKSSLSIANVNDFLSGVIKYFPEAASLKPFVVNDIIIYKLVYRTKVKGQEINASGLLCIPSKPGNYPVLSFQNGTNTLNSLAPSNNFYDLQYQMVELISSMGYIVVMADYPGFGASSDIPHPYLVKEPTVQSLVDMLFTVKEIGGAELGGVAPKDEYYLLGYSQGGWATLALHKALETEYGSDFNLAGSACGAGPYSIYNIFQSMAFVKSYDHPVYLGYILNAYSWYKEFSNPLTDILNEPYASRIPSLYNGNLSFTQINSQLTTSIPDLVKADFISGFQTDQKYSAIREALQRNSIQGWHTNKQLYLMHGGSDTQVPTSSTENMYNDMISAGTPPQNIKKEIFPGLDHGSGVVPIMIKGLLFLLNL